jgi:hypothetical protein
MYKPHNIIPRRVATPPSNTYFRYVLPHCPREQWCGASYFWSKWVLFNLGIRSFMLSKHIILHKRLWQIYKKDFDIQTSFCLKI